MSTYAANTVVSTARTREEIERTLTRYGATGFMYGWRHGEATIAFTTKDRQVRFLLPMPDRNDARFQKTPTGRPRRSSAIEAEYEQAVRQRWRALSLVIKAKLQAVESGIVTFEDEFAMHTVLPDGHTVRDYVLPAITEAYASGTVPALTMGGGS